MTAHWGIHLTGDFEKPNVSHFLQCCDERPARTRAAWWRDYRTDVDVRVCVMEPGGRWRAADFEPVLPLAALPAREPTIAGKLTADDVARIKARLAAGHLRNDIAPAFGVSTSTIHRIAIGRTWAHVGEVA